jgi:hypothetical protein
MLDRRSFLALMGSAAGALFLTDEILADPHQSVETETAAFTPIRVRGRVHAGGRGIGAAGVSDGLLVVGTDRDGRFEFVTSPRRRFVHLSLPAGYRIPVNDAGTARLYRPIRADGGEEMEVEFPLDPLRIDDRRHAFILMADPQTLDAEDVERLHGESVPDIRKTVRNLSPAPLFGVACGDIVYDRLEYFPEYERAVHRIGIPCFQVLGNHDVDVASRTDEQSALTFERYFGPTYYSFNRGEIHYVVLDDIFWFGGYIGYLDQMQLDWLRADLSLVERGGTVVVFMHIPPFNEYHLQQGRREPLRTTAVTNLELLYRLLEPFNAYIICGHMHESEYLRDSGAEIHVCGALSGAWWSDSICYDGTPNGYGVYRADGSNLTWRYQSTGKDARHQMRLYPPGSVLDFPTEFAANVWGADSSWEVVWYEGGMRKGKMKRRLCIDPLAMRLYEGPNLPRKHPWVDPVRTYHIFTAKPSAAGREVVVEAIDRWGRVYSERLEW